MNSVKMYKLLCECKEELDCCEYNTNLEYVRDRVAEALKKLDSVLDFMVFDNEN